MLGDEYMLEVTFVFEKEDRNLFNPFLEKHSDNAEIHYSSGLSGGSEPLEFISQIAPSAISSIAGVVAEFLKSKKLHIKFKNPSTSTEVELELVGFSKKESLEILEDLYQKTNDNDVRNIIIITKEISSKDNSMNNYHG